MRCSPGEAPTMRTKAELTAVHTALQQEVAQRRRAEERYRRSFEDAPIGIALVAPDGRWLQANGALCEILGYPAEVLLAKTFPDIIHPDDLDADRECVRQMLAGEIRT